MSKQEAIRNAVRAVKAHGFSLPTDLDKQIAGLENPQYRVAVVGEFQVGKSTLVNRVFLGDKPLLKEGEGNPTTAVATDIEYGPNSKLEVYDWTDEKRESETLVKTVSNPTEDDIKDATVATEGETRAALAKKRARVRIQTPNEALCGYTIIDTPGLDDPEEELLLNTTWRVIPSADVALLVVSGNQQLGDVQLKLLRKEIMGKNGLARIMVLASFNPEIMQQNAEQRGKLVGTIKAQLATRGRDNIPVEMYCFDTALGDIKLRDANRLLLRISNFLAENALPGREEKVANLIRMEIEKDLVEVAAKLKTIGTSDAERAALVAKVEAEVTRFKEKAERAFERFQDEVRALNDDIENDVNLAIDAVFDKFYAELSEKETLDMMKKAIERASSTLKFDLQDKMSVIGLKLNSDIERLVDHYGKDMEDCRRGWNVFISDEFEIKKPMVAKIPPIAFKAIEVALLNLILPFGWIIAILAKILLGDVFSPATWIAKKTTLAQIKKALDEAKPDVFTQVMQQVDAGIRKTFVDVKAAMEASNKAQVEAIRAVLATSPSESTDRTALESAKADFEAVLASL